MGADLILAYIWTTEPDWIDFEAARAAIGNVTEKELDTDNFPDGDPDDEPDWLVATAHTQLRADIAEIEKYWNGMSDRETDTYQFGPVRVLITGGTSWGDDPSAMYSVINRVPWSVFEAAGFGR